MIGLLLYPLEKGIRKRVFGIYSVIILTFIAGFRESVGGDTSNYISFYNYVISSSFLDIIKYNYEKGFIIYCYILSRISKNPQFLILISSFIINISVIIFLYKNSKYFAFSIILYINLTYFYSFMNLMRFGLSVALILQAYNYLKSNNYKIYFIFTLLAILFHNSAIIFLITWFFRKKTFSNYYFSLIIIISILITIYFHSFENIAFALFPMYKIYKNNIFFQGFRPANIIMAIMYLIILIIIRLISKNKINKIDSDDLEMFLFTIGESFSILAIASTIIGRFSLIFLIFGLIVISNSFKNIKNKINRITFIYTIYIVSFAYNIIIIYYRPEWFLVTPYRNVLF